MEVPRLGVKLELQLPASATAIPPEHLHRPLLKISISNNAWRTQFLSHVDFFFFLLTFMLSMQQHHPHFTEGTPRFREVKTFAQGDSARIAEVRLAAKPLFPLCYC